MANFLSGKKKIMTMILGIISGLAIVFGVDQGDVSTISGAVVAVSSVVGYLIAEGRIDVERIKNAAESVNDALDLVDDLIAVKGFVDDGDAESEVEQP